MLGTTSDIHHDAVEMVDDRNSRATAAMRGHQETWRERPQPRAIRVVQPAM
jgi:hypothetical protein